MQSEGIHMELKVLYQNGWSISQLAREFGLNIGLRTPNVTRRGVS